VLARCWREWEEGRIRADIRGIGVRPFTFFEKGVVGHVGFADPFDTKIGKVFPPSSLPISQSK
jgi:hypothetical protein